MSTQPLTHEDMYIIGDAATKNNDYGLAAQWFDKAARYSDRPRIDTYLQLAKAQKEVTIIIADIFINNANNCASF